MTSVFERRLLVITGKGGVGKTTVAAIIGLLAAGQGLRAVVVEVGEQGRVPALFGLPPRKQGVETELSERLWSLSIDLDRALLEWLQMLGGPVSGRLLASSGTFQYFAAAAPGARELVSMVKIWELTQGERWRRSTAGYDLVVLDAPATGHALGMLHSPWTFGAIARVGPIAGQTRRVRELLEDPARSGYLAVAHATEMAVSEALEVQDGLRRQLGRELDAVIVNGILPQRFTDAELRRIAQLDRLEGPAVSTSAVTATGDPVGPSPLLKDAGTTGAAAVTRSAALAARSVHDRARLQRSQLARLRRRRLRVLGVPFVFGAELDLPAIQRLAEQLGRKL
jgi:anion-transporting  ArsA/GET3 family ATPase